jgi:hypothetical protein
MLEMHIFRPHLWTYTARNCGQQCFHKPLGDLLALKFENHCDNEWYNVYQQSVTYLSLSDEILKFTCAQLLQTTDREKLPTFIKQIFVFLYLHQRKFQFYCKH